MVKESSEFGPFLVECVLDWLYLVLVFIFTKEQTFAMTLKTPRTAGSLYLQISEWCDVCKQKCVTTFSLKCKRASHWGYFLHVIIKTLHLHWLFRTHFTWSTVTSTRCKGHCPGSSLQKTQENRYLTVGLPVVGSLKIQHGGR